jgi:Ca2+-binding EF-hand superfamily protein
MKKNVRFLLSIALAMLALAFVLTPLTSRAEDAAPEKKLSKAKEKFDADKDGKLNDEEKAAAKEAAVAKAKQTREENLKKALEKYDANGNGKLDDDEKAKMKADEQAELEARKAEKAAKKAAKEAEKN